MVSRKGLVDRCAHFTHRYFIYLLLGCYIVAAIWPDPGKSIRNVSFGEITFRNEHSKVTFPMIMLSFLLLNAGLGVKTSELRNLLKTPVVVVAGLVANTFIPLVYIFIVSLLLRFYHDADEAQHILIGLALIVAMPIAGSSTAWTQNANGDLTLSLSLVLFSTLLSPLTTPLTFDAVEHMSTGEYAKILDDLETNGTGFLLVFCVLLPSILGIILHGILGAKRVEKLKPLLKLINSLDLLLLNYSNAAVSLPQLIAKPDWDWLILTFIIVLCLCIVAFGAGWLIGYFLRTEPPERVSLIFGLGMNNNGTGLVLASLALSHYPATMLPVIFYTLLQHLVAGIVDAIWCLKEPESS